MADNPTDLSKLHDIVVPDAVSWWPLAPGWWVLIITLAGGLLLFGVQRLRRWRADAYRRSALVALEAARSTTEISRLLRRVALAFTPRESIAALHDDEWIRWLGEQSPLPVPPEIEETLTQAPYSEQGSEAATDTLRQFAGQWIRHHRRPC